MSRSYKKTPQSGDRKTYGKKFANRKFRRLMSRDLRNNYHHSEYKRNYCQYDICDYQHFPGNFNEYYQQRLAKYNYDVRTGHDWEWNRYLKCRVRSTKPTKEEVYKEWYKWYKMK